jgi:hypothetical protein
MAKKTKKAAATGTAKTAKSGKKPMTNDVVSRLKSAGSWESAKIAREYVNR